MSTTPATPDFYTYEWHPISNAWVGPEAIVHVEWTDGVALPCHSAWLFENAVRPGAVDLATREGTADPARLPASFDDLIAGVTLVDGALEVRWNAQLDIAPDRYHPGWLRHVADGLHDTRAHLPAQISWDARSLPEPPTHHGPSVLADDAAMAAWLADAAAYGIARVTDLAPHPDELLAFARRIGAIRDTNFGEVWWVQADIDPASTANTGMRLMPHTDLPTRETPPGFQLLHCIENTCTGGTSRMTDGLRVVERLAADEPHHYEALTTLDWVFFNRSPDHDHRWTGPIIDHGAPGQPLTLRAFHPVRAFPAMDAADVGRAYAALRRFSQIAADADLQIGYPFRPGDLVAFDNRRILHGRDAFEPTAGSRRLRGCYIDHDEIYSRIRVLARCDVHA